MVTSPSLFPPALTAYPSPLADPVRMTHPIWGREHGSPGTFTEGPHSQRSTCGPLTVSCGDVPLVELLSFNHKSSPNAKQDELGSRGWVTLPVLGLGAKLKVSK